MASTPHTGPTLDKRVQIVPYDSAQHADEITLDEVERSGI